MNINGKPFQPSPMALIVRRLGWALLATFYLNPVALIIIATWNIGVPEGVMRTASRIEVVLALLGPLSLVAIWAFHHSIYSDEIKRQVRYIRTPFLALGLSTIGCAAILLAYTAVFVTSLQ